MALLTPQFYDSKKEKRQHWTTLVFNAEFPKPSTVFEENVKLYENLPLSSSGRVQVKPIRPPLLYTAIFLLTPIGLREGLNMQLETKKQENERHFLQNDLKAWESSQFQQDKDFIPQMRIPWKIKGKQPKKGPN